LKKIHRRTKCVGLLGATCLLAAVACAQAGDNGHADMSSPQAREGYSLGFALGGKLAHELDGADSAALVQGFSDALQQQDPAIGADEMAQAISSFEAQRAEAAQADLAAIAMANAAAGDAFREQFAKEDGTVSLDNGLLYQVIEPGAGGLPEPDSSVTLNYRGTLIDGTPLDDSYSRGEPVTVTLDRVLPGWSAALERMPAGAKWKVVIPPSLAYGEAGAGRFVEPNATLVFELERLPG
jgi:FKBP-type peptidyl-prolyl cis-trans isomerase